MCTTVSPFKKPTTKLQTPPPKADEANHQSLLQEKRFSKAPEITSDRTLDLHPIPPFYVPHIPRSKHSLPCPQYTKM
jgi:hypothetical protein